jgi:hypothetical protein
MDVFLREGRVPGVHEGNQREPLVPLGRRWNGYGQVAVGASLEAACESPAHLAAAIAAFPRNCPYIMTYRPDKDKVFVVLREGADRDDALDAAFVAHLWLHELQESLGATDRKCMVALPAEPRAHAKGEAAVAADPIGLESLPLVQSHGNAMWRVFSDQAVEQGWQLKGTMLAIGDSRLLSAP